MFEKGAALYEVAPFLICTYNLMLYLLGIYIGVSLYFLLRFTE